jgi:hypothetical protein
MGKHIVILRATLEDAIRDYSTGYHEPILRVDKAIIVVARRRQ